MIGLTVDAHFAYTIIASSHQLRKRVNPDKKCVLIDFSTMRFCT